MQVGQRRDKRGGPRSPASRIPSSSSDTREKARDPEKPLLRLALARGSLALELDGEALIGPLSVTELSVLLPDVRFPVDLTGGVAKFRHRRGALATLVVAAKTDALARYVAPRLRGLLSPGVPEVVIAPSTNGALIGIGAPNAALAFDVLLAPMGADLRIVLEAPRGIGLDAPAFVIALRALAAMLKPIGVRRGGLFVIADLASELARNVLPEAGARAPSVRGVEMALGPMSARSVVTIEAHEGAEPPELSRRAIRALELNELVEAADDAAVRGDLEIARAGYLSALERAPRHPDVALRLAAIDLAIGDRAEAALGTVVEAMPATEAGVVGGELLTAVGDDEAAYGAFAHIARSEPYGPLAALIWLAAAKRARDPALATEALDAALVRSPGNLDARWERLSARLALGDVRGAVGDAEHIEAATSGASLRHLASARAGSLFAQRGYMVEAATRFERALRYSPSSPEAVLGLARALRDMGKTERALDLFARASALGERKGKPSPSCELELARALAEHARDLPTAIARVLRVPQQTPETFEARLLEGRWRAMLGDLTGAGRALARLREAAEVFPGPVEDRNRVARWLIEAARIDEREVGDLRAAHRDLSVALRLAPRDGEAATELRRLGVLLASPTAIATSTSTPTATATSTPTSTPTATAAPTPTTSRSAQSISPEEGDEIDESQVEQLTAELRANPSDHQVALALARLLTLLGRDLELLALLSARIEEGDAASRADLVPIRREALARLAASSRSEGRNSEAEIYELMRDAE